MLVKEAEPLMVAVPAAQLKTLSGLIGYRLMIIHMDEFDLFFEESGTGFPVVYVHGGFPSLAMTLRTQDPLEWTWELDFAARFRFIWYDRRGCYRSSLPSDGFGLQKQARDLERLLDHLAIAEVQLVGSSAGGPIAVLFASNFPDRVRSLVLVGTALHLFPLGDEPSDLIRQQLLVLDRDGPDFAFDARPAGVEVSFDPLWEREQAEASGTLDEFQKAQQKLSIIAKQVPKQERIKWYVAELNSIRAYVEADLRVAASLVEAPTLVIHGGKDKVVPLEWAKGLADAIPGSTLHVVEGEGHGLMSRDPGVRTVVIDFFAAHTEDSPGHDNIDRR